MFRTQPRRGTALEVEKHSKYPYRLSLYTEPPTEEITLEQFEQWAIDRMQVLDKLDSLGSRPRGDMERDMRPVLQKHLPLSVSNKRSTDEERRKDHFSHYILRLAFCRSAELKTRFIRLETLLFKFRYSTDDPEDRRRFVESLGLELETVDEAEKTRLLGKLAAANGGTAAEKYIKTDWGTVPDLVARRGVYVRGGKAFVPDSQQLSLIANEYSKSLQKALDATSRLISRLDEDQRLLPVLDNLSSGFGFGSYKSDTAQLNGKITADSMDALDREHHLPMCQSYMHRELGRRRHAHYDAREQYTRFLKYIGMPLEEAVRLWRRAYQGGESDRKAVEYQVRHQYGTVGGHINYKPLSCKQIYDKGKVADSDHIHGCPFQRLSPERLGKQLEHMSITDPSAVAEIQRLSSQRMVTMACGKVYELTHPDDHTVYTEGIMYPNQYFDRSWNFKKSQEK